MKSYKYLFLKALVWVGIMYFAPMLFSQDCDGVFRDGVFGTTEAWSKSELHSLTKSWLLRQNYEDRSTKKGEKMRSIFESQQENGDVSYSKDAFTNWVQSYKEAGASLKEWSSVEEDYFFQSLADKAVLDAWITCRGGDDGLHGRVTKLDHGVYELQLYTTGQNNKITFQAATFHNMELIGELGKGIQAGDRLKFPFLVKDTSEIVIMRIPGTNSHGNSVTFTYYIPVEERLPIPDFTLAFLKKAFTPTNTINTYDGTGNGCVAFAEDSLIVTQVSISPTKTSFTIGFNIVRFHVWGKCGDFEYNTLKHDVYPGTVSGTFTIADGRVVMDLASVACSHTLPPSERSNIPNILLEFARSRNGFSIGK